MDMSRFPTKQQLGLQTHNELHLVGYVQCVLSGLMAYRKVDSLILVVIIIRIVENGLKGDFSK